MVQKMIWKILMVDDDEDDYLLMREMLSLAQGKEILVEWVSTAEAGLQALKSGQFDAALIDYDLGAKTGLDLIRAVDPQNYSAPLILLSGRAGYEVDLEAMQAGATLYLNKGEVNPLLLDRSIRYAIEHKQAELALKEARKELERRAAEAEESKRILDALLEFIPEGITIASAPNVVTLRTSQYSDDTLMGGAEKPLGFSMPDWLAKVEHYLADGVTPAGMEDLPLTRAVKHGEKIEGKELILRRPNGDLISVLCNAGPIRDGAGEITGGIVAWRDITERKHAEQALQEAHQQVEWLARLPDENPNPVIRVSFDGIALYRNPPAARLEGWRCVVGQPVNPTLAALTTRAAAQGSEIVEDVQLDGGFYSVSVVPILDKGYANIYGRDASRRKMVENALAQSEVRWSTTLASIGDAVLATDTAGVITFMNAVAEQLTGWTLPEARQKPVQEVFCIINENTRQTVLDPVTKVLENGLVIGLANHTLLVRKDGSEIPIDDSGAPIKGPDGRIEGVVLVFRDVSERRLKEDQLARLSQLYATLSHVNETIVRTHDEKTLFSEMCQIISAGGFPLVWIGEVQDGQVTPVAHCGPAAGYLNEIKVTLEGELSQGPTGTCIREDRAVINPDFDANPATLPWREAALRYGIRSSAAFPLHRHGKPAGALTLYAPAPNLFDPQQVALLEQLSVDISYAMDALDREQLNVRSEQALRLSEEHYRSLFNGITEGFALHEIICDPEGRPFDYRFLEINPAFETLTGLKRQGVIGRSHNEVLPGDDPYWVEVYGRVALSGETVHFENYSPALKQHYEVYAYRPAPGQFAALFLNITERKRIEEKLRESENRYRSLFESMHEGFYLAHILYDENGAPCDFEYLEANPAFEKIMGLQRDQIIGRRAKELVPELKPEWLQTFSKVEQTGEAGRHTSYSDVFHHYFETFSFRPAKGQFAVIVTDISERMQSEEALHDADRLLKEYAKKLERSNRELQEFTSIASHDLQEPLRKIRSFGDLLQSSLTGQLNEQERSYLERMVKASKRMQELIDSLLAFSRVSTKVQSSRPVDLGQVAAEVVSGMDLEIERVGGRVELGPLPEIEADPLQMRQLLQNLISNALKFHRPDVPPIVQVSGQVEPAPEGETAGCIRIEVKDNGIGFDVEYLDRIFQPFERLHGRIEFEGTGMGLAICKKIVDRHQGKITAQSVQGVGTTFIVILPIKQTA